MYSFLQSDKYGLPKLQPWFQGVQQVGLVLDFGRWGAVGLQNPQLSDFFSIDKYTFSAISDLTSVGQCYGNELKIKGVFVQVTQEFQEAKKKQKKESLGMFQALEIQTIKLLNSVEVLHLVDHKGKKEPENFMSKTQPHIALKGQSPMNQKGID